VHAGVAASTPDATESEIATSPTSVTSPVVTNFRGFIDLNVGLDFDRVKADFRSVFVGTVPR
jgi:hypothetical protein